MQKEKQLSSADKKRIWLELKQVLVGYAAAGLVAVFLTAALVIFLVNRGLETGALVLVILLISVGAIGVLYLLTRHYLLDLLRGTKYVYQGQITDKTNRVHWGWHGNPAADAASQPYLTEFVLWVDGREVKTEEGKYKSFGVGDNVWVHVAVGSKLILALGEENMG